MLLNTKIKNNDRPNSGLMLFKSPYTQGQFILFQKILINGMLDKDHLAEIVENGT